MAISKHFHFACVLSVALLAACGDRTATNSNRGAVTETPTPETATATPQTSPLTGFEKDLRYVRNGQFNYVWVFSRKDGKPLDKDDSAFLRTNAPHVVDWVVTAEGRKVIAGTNFAIEEANLEALKKRFVAEDYSGR